MLRLVLALHRSVKPAVRREDQDLAALDHLVDAPEGVLDRLAVVQVPGVVKERTKRFVSNVNKSAVTSPVSRNNLVES